MKYEPEYNEIPLMDIRIVDNIELSRDRWITKAMDKFVSLTESIYDNDNCPSNIPHHNCPRSKEITINKQYEPDDIVRVCSRHDPDYKFLCRRKEIDDLNSKLPYPQFVIDDEYGKIPKPEIYGELPNNPTFTHAGTINDYPHPSNHHMDLVDKIYENKTRYDKY